MKNPAHHLIVISILLFSGSAISADDIGRVIHSNGTLVASNGGSDRILLRGSSIKEGDLIKTDATARSQLRMKDGALIVLRQNSEMRFEAYQYDEQDKSVGSSILNLVKGGFKTLSGMIGKRNKQNYKVKTAFTTIGIRGTDYGVTICEQGNCSDGDGGVLEDGLYASVIDGEISSENEAGLYIFSNDEYFYVASNSSEPQSLLKAPGVIFDPNTIATNDEEMAIDNQHAELLTADSLDQDAASYTHLTSQNKDQNTGTFIPFYEAASDVNSNTHMITSQPGDAMLFSYFQGTAGALSAVSQILIDDGSTSNRFALNAIAAENGQLLPLASHITFGAAPTTRTLYIANATSSDTGAMVLAGNQVSWGRWSGDGYETTEDGVTTAHSGSLHYAVIDGGLTTPTQIAALTGNFNYTTVAGTRATDLDGNVATSVANVNMAVDFGLQNIDSYSVVTQVGGIDYQAELIAPTSITTALNDGMALAGNTAGACPTCGGLASLGFVGSQAEGAITSYNIGNAGMSTAITGTVILQR